MAVVLDASGWVFSFAAPTLRCSRKTPAANDDPYLRHHESAANMKHYILKNIPSLSHTTLVIVGVKTKPHAHMGSFESTRADLVAVRVTTIPYNCNNGHSEERLWYVFVFLFVLLVPFIIMYFWNVELA